MCYTSSPRIMITEWMNFSWTMYSMMKAKYLCEVGDSGRQREIDLQMSLCIIRFYIVPRFLVARSEPVFVYKWHKTDNIQYCITDTNIFFILVNPKEGFKTRLHLKSWPTHCTSFAGFCRDILRCTNHQESSVLVGKTFHY